MEQFLTTPHASRARWVVAVFAVVAAVAHIPVTGEHLREAPYMGWLFIVLTVGCLSIAGAALVRDSSAVYALAVLTCGLAVAGYAATRLTAFPMLSDDVGNWLEPLGVVSVITETIVVVAAIVGLRHRAQPASRISTSWPSTVRGG
ncbi:hypothetical protein [Allobranchiibius huperziae]|uniref:Cytochrome bd-type quinol oxidase subunit 2 n=1 Tax=Allobranchiibius huperziae TaxID=1874116 RepID=A0A853DIY1_9MICO|nr:hypothetical protein [Allobranchiibius huperziae]NYJ74741.1 cytochrome bd-type quinol oxidase subunit 2 [Allobranchiibius huperziae]